MLTLSPRPLEDIGRALSDVDRAAEALPLATRLLLPLLTMLPGPYRF
jgi:hypothetical protein